MNRKIMKLFAYCLSKRQMDGIPYPQCIWSLYSPHPHIPAAGE